MPSCMLRVQYHVYTLQLCQRHWMLWLVHHAKQHESKVAMSPIELLSMDAPSLASSLARWHFGYSTPDPLLWHQATWLL